MTNTRKAVTSEERLLEAVTGNPQKSLWINEVFLNGPVVEMIPLVQKNWIPQRVGLEDRVSEATTGRSLGAQHTCYLGPLFLASDVTCRKQIKEKKKKNKGKRHFFFMCVKRVLGLRIEGQPLSLMSL